MNEFDEKDVKLTELTRQYNGSISFVIFFVDMVFDQLWITYAQNFLELVKLSKDDKPVDGIRNFGEGYQRVPCFNLESFLDDRRLNNRLDNSFLHRFMNLL